MMTCKDVETKIFPCRDKERIGGRNIVADIINEVAAAIGFDTDWLKEEFNHNKPYRFRDSDYEAIKNFMEAAKSAKGKRLRCRYYKGATGLFIDEIAEFFITLAIHNGVDKKDLGEQWLKILVYTDCEIVRWCIRELTDEFEDDIENRYFMTSDRAVDGFEDDHISSVAKLAFLQYVLGNIDNKISEIRGVYWFFKSKYESEQYREIRELGKYIRQLSTEQFEQFKENINLQLDYNQAIDSDEILAEKTNEWLWIERWPWKDSRYEEAKREA